MGCGKSSVGRKLSELLCCPFMDLDDVIEQTEGRSIPEIFATDGEPAFRQMELEALASVLSLPLKWNTSGSTELILALGGGTVMTPECREIVEKNTICIYLKASVETLLEHLEGQTERRPMLSGQGQIEKSEKADNSELRSKIEQLMSKRAAIYERTAHIIIDTDGKSIKSVAEEAIRVISSHPSRGCL